MAQGQVGLPMNLAYVKWDQCVVRPKGNRDGAQYGRRQRMFTEVHELVCAAH